MISFSKYSLLALFAGGLLAVMIDINSALAVHSTPLETSWLAHGIGAIVAYVIACVCLPVSKSTASKATEYHPRVPRYLYLGGVAGAFTVVLASVSVNSQVGLAGTLALALAGQLLTTMMCEHFGWLGVPKKSISSVNSLPLLLVVLGALLIIVGRA